MRFSFLTADYERCPTDMPPTRISFECPLRPGQMCGALLLHGNPQNITVAGKMWHWNGNRAKPTLTPRIHCHQQNGSHRQSGCGAHGHIENGAWRPVERAP